MRLRLFVLGLIVFVGLAGVIAGAAATEERPTLGLDGVQYPLVGEPVRVLISHASYPELERFQVKVTYRPNSDVSKEEVLPPPNDFGTVEWTPTAAGITILTAEAPAIEGFEAVKLTLQISVRHGGFPLSGLLIFVFSMLTLFGGLALVILKTTGKSPAQHD
ncbi:MAG: hypothetical protein IGS03_11315 [Candidatus Sericytochromatia bacterium]|nr:hypothetical protein [Candidatus Sericytochromatia bacterium]